MSLTRFCQTLLYLTFLRPPERVSPRKCYKSKQSRRASDGRENRYSSCEKSFHSWLFAQNPQEGIIGSRLRFNERRRLLCRSLISLMNKLCEVVDACVPSHCKNSRLSMKRPNACLNEWTFHRRQSNYSGEHISNLLYELNWNDETIRMSWLLMLRRTSCNPICEGFYGWNCATIWCVGDVDKVRDIFGLMGAVMQR